MSNILEKLDDLIKQATEERSHFYVKGCAEEAKARIIQLENGLAAVASSAKSPVSMSTQMLGMIAETALAPDDQ